jgi:diguanylate cyclase (GGDEF)-like protein
MARRILAEFRLMAVVGLLLIPIGLLGWLFVHKSYVDVKFAQKELVGTHYLRSLVPIYAKLIASEAPTQAQINEFHQERLQFDAELEVGQLAAVFENTISSDLISYVTAKQIARTLISNVGDKSNLILDPDLDTYYLMDVALLKLPNMMALSAQLTEVTASRANVIDPLRGTQKQNLIAGLIGQTSDDIKQSMNKAFSGNPDGTLRGKVLQNFKDFEAAENQFLINTVPVRSSQVDHVVSPLLVYENHRKFTASTLTFSKQVFLRLDQLLKNRISVFISRLVYSVGISIVLTLAAVALAVSLLQRLLVKMDDKIVYLAHHDSMTRLKNRGAFTSDMNAVLALAKASGEQVALHLIDLDNFKTVNDTLGHQTGDGVLKCLAERLLKYTRPTDIVGRFGGDEFVVLQRFVANEQAAKAFADRLVFAMREPVSALNQVIHTSISIGSAVYALHAKTADTLMAYADMALYSAKAAGRDQTSLFTAELEAEVQQRRRVEDEVRRAVAEDRFTLNFQAQYDSAGVKIRGFEALLRLRSTTGQFIPPTVFIPVAEQLGLIQQIGTWVLNHACLVAAQWPKEISLAVNLSPLQFSTGGVAEIITQALSASGFEAKRLQVEITEGILMDNTEAVLAELTAIRALGVSIVMDDFGTGYSSLGYLWRFPFDKIKIDRSFISALEGDEIGAQNILRTIVSLGHSLEMTVTAEGVETSAQADFMSGLDCDEIQGFLYGRPVPEEDLSAIILSSFQKSNNLDKKTVATRAVVRKSKAS